MVNKTNHSDTRPPLKAEGLGTNTRRTPSDAELRSNSILILKHTIQKTATYIAKFEKELKEILRLPESNPLKEEFIDNITDLINTEQDIQNAAYVELRTIEKELGIKRRIE